MDYIHELRLKVRDYECDLQGIVNNANYQHYLEHARHEFLLSTGAGFAELHRQGIDPVVARITMAFKTPLRSGDEFICKLYLRKEGIKYVFYQDIYRAADNRLALKGVVEAVCVVNGRLSNSPLFDQLFAPIDRPGVTVTEASRLDLLRYDRPRRKNFFIPSLFQQPAFDRRMYEMDTSRRFREHFDFEAWARGHKVYIAAFVYFYEPRTEWDRFALFEPHPLLKQEIETRRARFGDHTIGVHIRRTDNAISIAQSPTRLFVDRMQQEIDRNADTTFYLATDSEEDKALITARFGDRVFCSPHRADRNSLEGMREALIELYLLSHTRQVLGSVHSSYSETAAQIGHIPYELLQKKEPR